MSESSKKSFTLLTKTPSCDESGTFRPIYTNFKPDDIVQDNANNNERIGTIIDFLIDKAMPYNNKIDADSSMQEFNVICDNLFIYCGKAQSFYKKEIFGPTDTSQLGFKLAKLTSSSLDDKINRPLGDAFQYGIMNMKPICNHVASLFTFNTKSLHDREFFVIKLSKTKDAYDIIPTHLSVHFEKTLIPMRHFLIPSILLVPLVPLLLIPSLPISISLLPGLVLPYQYYNMKAMLRQNKFTINKEKIKEFLHEIHSRNNTDYIQLLELIEKGSNQAKLESEMIDKNDELARLKRERLIIEGQEKQRAKLREENSLFRFKLSNSVVLFFVFCSYHVEKLWFR